jgi:hypothetical protein
VKKTDDVGSDELYPPVLLHPDASENRGRQALEVLFTFLHPGVLHYHRCLLRTPSEIAKSVSMR